MGSSCRCETTHCSDSLPARMLAEETCPSDCEEVMEEGCETGPVLPGLCGTGGGQGCLPWGGLLVADLGMFNTDSDFTCLMMPKTNPSKPRSCLSLAAKLSTGECRETLESLLFLSPPQQIHQVGGD